MILNLNRFVQLHKTLISYQILKGILKKVGAAKKSRPG